MVYLLNTGYRINITVMDFGLWSRNSKKGVIGSQHNSHCDKYATLYEPALGQETPICAGEQRTRNVYLSKTSTLDVALIPESRGEEMKHFLIKYEGNNYYVNYINNQNCIKQSTYIHVYVM